MRDVTITFKATPELAQWLATLGAQSDSTRSNTVYTILVAAMHNQTADMVRILKARP
jgi:hypothetical protein